MNNLFLFSFFDFDLQLDTYLQIMSNVILNSLSFLIVVISLIVIVKILKRQPYCNLSSKSKLRLNLFIGTEQYSFIFISFEK